MRYSSDIYLAFFLHLQTEHELKYRNIERNKYHYCVWSVLSGMV